MKRYYSGTGSAANPGGSLGGAITSNEIANATVNAVWDDVSLTEASAGDTEYRCFYIKWVGPETIYNIVLFFSSKAGGADDSVFLGKGTSAKNGTEQTIANEGAIPSGVSFDNPDQRSEAILINSQFNQNDRQAVWLKRVINPNADVLNLEDYELECQFDPSSGGGTGGTTNPPTSGGGTGSTGTYVHGFGGDTDCNSTYTTNINNMKNKDVKRFIPLGDYSYDDTADCWKSDTNPLRDRIKALVMGNHEVEEGAPSSLKSSYMNWVGQSNQWAHYIYRNQSYLFLSYYASYGTGSSQYNFALSKLKQYATDPNIKWRFVMFHEPMYTLKSDHAVEHGSFRDLYHPLFDTYNVDVCMFGHNHNWQRSFPISHSGGSTPTKESSLTTNYTAPFDGQIHIGCGTLGRSSDSIGDTKSYFVTDDNSKYEQHGYGILEFSNNELTLKIKFYNTSNSLIDTCTINHS